MKKYIQISDCIFDFSKTTNQIYKAIETDFYAKTSGIIIKFMKNTNNMLLQQNIGENPEPKLFPVN